MLSGTFFNPSSFSAAGRRHFYARPAFVPALRNPYYCAVFPPKPCGCRAVTGLRTSSYGSVRPIISYRGKSVEFFNFPFAATTTALLQSTGKSANCTRPHSKVTVHTRHSQSRAYALYAATQLPLLINGRSLRPLRISHLFVQARHLPDSGGRVNCNIQKAA